MKKNEDNNSLWDDLLLFGLINSIFGKSSQKKSNDNFLFQFEQDEVNRNSFSPFDFEEEDMEDDDFYFEDDE